MPVFHAIFSRLRSSFVVSRIARAGSPASECPDSERLILIDGSNTCKLGKSLRLGHWWGGGSPVLSAIAGTVGVVDSAWLAIGSC